MNITKRIALTSMIGVSALLLAACSGGATTPTTAPEPTATESPALPEKPDQLTKVTVGLWANVIDTAYLQLGVEQGFFADQNLEVEFVTVAGGDEGVSALVSGNVDFTIANVVTLIQAVDKGLPIRGIVGAVSGGGQTDPDAAGIFVPEGSSVQSPIDLEGKKVGVFQINDVTALWVLAAVEQDGGDPTTIQQVTGTQVDRRQLLEAGEIDATLATGGFFALAQADGHHLLLNPQKATMGPNAPSIFMLVNSQWADQNPAVARAFQIAAGKSADYAEQHRDEWRAILPELFPNVVPDAEAASKVSAYWSSCLTQDGLAKPAEYMTSWGWIDNQLTAEDLIWEQSPPFC